WNVWSPSPLPPDKEAAMTYNDPNDPNLRTNPPLYRDESRGGTAMWVIALLVLILVIGGLFYAANRNQQTVTNAPASPSQTTGSGTTTPTPAPQPSNPPASPSPPARDL